MSFLAMYHDLLEYIKGYLSFKDRVAFLRLCKETSKIKLHAFHPCIHRMIEYPHSPYKTHQLCYNPFSNASHLSFIGNNYVNIIIYDTPLSYYNIRIMKEYEEGKTIEEYLREYKPNQLFMNKITRYY
jgi:hypothetical protein